ASKAYRASFVSGSDSLNNQFRTQHGRVIEIPPTLLITGIGPVHDVTRCVTMDLKPGASQLYLLASADPADPRVCAAVAQTLADQIADGRVVGAHDCSEGGALVAVAEMALATAGAVGVELDSALDWFAEVPGRYIVQVRASDTGAFERAAGAA